MWWRRQVGGAAGLGVEPRWAASRGGELLSRWDWFVRLALLWQTRGGMHGGPQCDGAPNFLLCFAGGGVAAGEQPDIVAEAIVS